MIAAASSLPKPLSRKAMEKAGIDRLDALYCALRADGCIKVVLKPPAG